MTRHRAGRAIAILVLLHAVALASAAEPDGMVGSTEPDWPQWRGPGRDGVSPEKNLLPAWPADGPKLLWKAENVGRGWAAPIVVKDTLYIAGDIGDDTVIHALGVDGKPKWKMPNGRAWTGSYPGTRSSCAYSEGVLYHMNAHGRLAAMDAASGKERWAIDVLERFAARNIPWAISESLLIDGGRIIVTPGGSKALMAAINKANGQTVWTAPPGPKASYNSPILFRHGGRRIIASTSAESGFAVDADNGRLLWTVPLRNTHGVSCTAPLYRDGVVLFITTDGPNASAYRLNADGSAVETAWKSGVDTLTSAPILVGDTLFTSGSKNSKALYALDWKTGRELYSLQLSTRRNSYAAVAMVHADGRLYCLAEDGTAALLVPGIAGFETAGKFKLVDAKRGDAWAHPVLLDGRLYLRYHETLWCYEAGAKR